MSTIVKIDPQSVEKIKREILPGIVYTHFWNDLNLDHRLVAQAAATAFRPRPGGENVSLLQFEVPESTYLSIPGGQKAFAPSYWVDISSTLSLKLKALAAYASERREYPDLRSEKFPQKLAQRRGKMKNMKFAEAFVELKRSLS